MAPKKEKEKNQHMQVVVRCRPLNSSERKHGSLSVVEVCEDKKEVTIKDRSAPTTGSKTFTFDRAFGTSAKQIDLYKSVVSPMVNEALTGYNCTVLAYGQTGTGKTFTMEGERTDDPSMSWEDDPLAGIIPRSMHELFTRLENMECEHAVKVSFLEIYNEELIDLLGASSVENPRLKIYEDVAKKGSPVIRGLEEVIVHDKSEVYQILAKGAARRQTAATQMNACSSRSHSLFTVTIHIKENTVDGEELLKIGKLNLVDLAGSECIGRSGAQDKRAREAGNINQSLLTLGRVITALVEHAPHIPYRESKLTRLLQDSLGGRTKTSIIATISPASSNFDETMSTLDYAHRAKNITNRPEVNQKMTKKALISEYTEELERLRKDLQAARDKNGIFLAQENYEEMQKNIAQQEDRIKEYEEKIKIMTEEFNKLTDLFAITKEDLDERTNELNVVTKDLEDTTDTLKKTQTSLRHTRQDNEEQKFLVSEHVKAETTLHAQANELLSAADDSTKDVFGLHDKLDRVKKVECTNEDIKLNFQQKFQDNIDDMSESLKYFTDIQVLANTRLQGNFDILLERKTKEVDELEKSLSHQLTSLSSNMKALASSHASYIDKSQLWAKEMEDKCIVQRDSEICRQTSFHDTFEAKITKILVLIKEQNEAFKGFRELLKENSTAQKAKMIELESLLQEQKELVVTFGAKQNAKFEEHKRTWSEHMASQDAFMKQMAEMFTQFFSVFCNNKEKMHTKGQSIVEEIEEVGKVVEEFSLTTQENLRQQTSVVTEHLKQHKESLPLQEETHKRDVENILQTTETLAEAIKTKEKENHSQFTPSVEEQKTYLESQKNEMRDWSESTITQLTNRSLEVNTFINEEIQNDIPTGLTPQIREFPYPRNLQKTGRHSVLLKDFREDYMLKEAMNLLISNESFDTTESSVGSVSDIPSKNIHDMEDKEECQSSNVSTDSAVSSASIISSTFDEESMKENSEMNIMKTPGKAAPKKRHGSSKQSGKTTPVKTPDTGADSETDKNSTPTQK